MTTAESLKVTGSTRRRYELFPHPERNPADEFDRLCSTGLDELAAINFYCYRGRRNIRRGFRVLVAGGGTGDALIYLAHQLRETNAQIVYLDLSETAMETAQARARPRKLQHRIQWLCGDLLDLRDMDLDPFDYINCSSVLHHLDDPLEGLKLLKSLLTEDGAMGLRVYGRYGRAGVQQMQQLTSLINDGETDAQVMLDNTRALIEVLPPTNWFKISGGVDSGSDSDLFHNLVDTNDRSFTVPQIYEMLDEAGLHFVEFTTRGRPLYTPHTALADPRTGSLVENLPKRKQQAIAELLHGVIKHHSFWVSAQESATIDVSDPENVPFFSHFARLHNLRDSITQSGDQQWSMKINLLDGYQSVLSLELVPLVKRFVALIDDSRTMGEIVEMIADDYDPRPSTGEVWKMCRHVIDTLLQYDLLLLRHASVPSLCTT